MSALEAVVPVGRGVHEEEADEVPQRRRQAKNTRPSNMRGYTEAFPARGQVRRLWSARLKIYKSSPRGGVPGGWLRVF